jgi:hypothetical protein
MKRTISAPQTPAATLDDAVIVMKIAEIGAKAISAAAVKQGLVGGPWDRHALYEEIAQVVAGALRATPNWWAGRTGGAS